MVENLQTTAERDIAWLAIRQPAVIRLLERELAWSDGDAFAAGLELAWSLLGDSTPWAHVRLDHAALAAGMTAVQARLSQTSEISTQLAPLVRSIRAHIADLPLTLSRAEQDAVVAVIAAVTRAALDAGMCGIDDTVLA